MAQYLCQTEDHGEDVSDAVRRALIEVRSGKGPRPLGTGLTIVVRCSKMHRCVFRDVKDDGDE